MAKKTGFIGAGNMANAIINGMLRAGAEAQSIVVFDVNREIIYNGRQVTENLDAYFTEGAGEIILADNGGDRSGRD